MIGWTIRNVLWPLMERRGNHIRAYMREMEQTQQLPRKEVDRLQRDKLEKLLQHAVDHVPAYRDYRDSYAAAKKQADFDPRVWLRQLPVLSKASFNAQRDAFLADNADRDALIASRTGGSTGEPTRFFMDRVTVEHYEAARWRGLSWHGVRIGDPSVRIWGSAIELDQAQTKKFWLKERWLKN